MASAICGVGANKTNLDIERQTKKAAGNVSSGLPGEKLTVYEIRSAPVISISNRSSSMRRVEAGIA
jgi:hypothetical protein